jgi:IclR family KDG regulon transcriptional repressor
MTQASSLKTVDRFVLVLDCFSIERPTWSLSELSERLVLPKSTLHRFLSSLESNGVLRKDPGDKSWRLGYKLFTWGSIAARSTRLCDLARPVMREVVDSCGETAILTVYDGREVVCIEKVETSQPVRLALDVGTRRPPHAGASSKVLMAHLPEGEIVRVIAEDGLPGLCTNTITDPQELMEELEEIRRLGYAESHEETDLGAWGVSTPIVRTDGEVVGAIGVAGPISRYTTGFGSECVRLCRQAAGRISLQMG